MGMAVGRDGPGGVWWTSSSSSTAPKESGKRAQRFGKHGTSSAPGREGRFGHPLAGAFPVRAHAYLVREHVGSVFSICLAGSPTQPALRSLSQREIYWSTVGYAPSPRTPGRRESCRGSARRAWGPWKGASIRSTSSALPRRPSLGPGRTTRLPTQGRVGLPPSGEGWRGEG